MKIPEFKLDKDQPSTCEVAFQDGCVVINYRSTVSVGNWGHLTFTPEQADNLIMTLQEARKQAVKGRN